MIQLFRALALVAVSLLVSAQARAGTDSFPERAVTLIVPFSAGGAGDQLARALGNQLAQDWKQPVVIENRPGANGILATQAVIRAKPDGYTLLLHNTTLIQVLSLMPKAGYDPFTQLEVAAAVGTQPIAIAVPANSPVKDIAQLVKELRKRDGKSYGTFGTGSTGHIYGEQFRAMYESDIVHVPYKGESPMLPDLISGRLAYGWISGATAREMQKGGALKVLALTGPSRYQGLKDTPTLAEAGIKGFEAVGWWALFAPAGTPEAVTQKIGAEIRETLRRQEFLQTLDQQAIAPSRMEPKDFAARIKSDHRWWGSVITQYGIRLD